MFLVDISDSYSRDNFRMESLAHFQMIEFRLRQQVFSIRAGADQRSLLIDIVVWLEYRRIVCIHPGIRMP